MSTSSRFASAVAGTSVLVLGWQLGTAHGQTVASTTPTRTAASALTSDATTSSSSGTSGTVTGETVSYRYGEVTVTVTLTNGKVTQVTENLVSDGDHHSDMINEMALPTLL